MSAIDSAIQKVIRSIPRPILKAGLFTSEELTFGLPTTIEDAIYSKVIGPFVIPKLSEFGQLREIPLTGVPWESIKSNVRVYRIPEESTDFRPIVSAHIAGSNIVDGRYHTPPQTQFYQANHSSVLNRAARITRAEQPQARITTAEVRVLAPYTVQIKEPYHFRNELTLYARVRISEDLNEIKPAFYEVIAKLVLYATKQYIYNNLILAMGSMRLEHGKDFSEFKNIVDSYSDAGDMFDDHLPLCSRCLAFNDDSANSVIRRTGGRYTS